MAQRLRNPIVLIAAALLLAAAPLRAMKLGRISLLKGSGGYVLQAQTDGLAAPTLQTADGKLIIVVPGGERSLKAISLAKGPVARIRFGMEGSDLHIVLDLREAAHGRIARVDATGFAIVLLADDSAPAKAAAAPEPTAAATADDTAMDVSATGTVSLDPSQVGYTYRVVDLSLGGDEKHSELVVSADGPASYSSSVRQDGRLLRLDFLNSTLAWSGDEKTLKDDAIAGVVIKQLSIEGESRVRVDIQLTGKLDYAFKRDQNQLVVRLARPIKTPAVAAAGDLNTPVSLDVQNADLVGVLKALCEQAGFEYQFTRSLLAKVPPESLVTMKAEGRPFHEVLDTLLAQDQDREMRLGNTIYMGTELEIGTRRASLPVVSVPYEPKYLTSTQIMSYLNDRYVYDDAERDRLKGIVADPRDPTAMLLVGTPDEVKGWETIIKQVDVPDAGDEGGEDSGGMRTQVFHLDYLDNSNVGLIDGAIAQLYPVGETAPTPLIDSSTRTLVVTTRPKYMRKIADILSKIDIRPLQVNIEGKIIEVDQAVSSELGVNWQASSASENPGITSAGFVPGIAPILTSQLSYGTVLDMAKINATLQAMIQTNKADLISAPNITTVDNMPATIQSTQTQVYVQTTTTISNGNVTNANAFTLSPVPLELVVTPKISRGDRKVLMNINFNLTTTDGQAPVVGAPLPTNQQQAITNVSVNSGETFVIGGLVKQNNTEEVQKVPFLSDIPLLGLLFRFNQINKSKDDVVIFIKPTIVGY
ncbi:MAG TPA: AMIN domain-containing protein [bacterium]|jgi:type II secretory pathway component HofQ|nr:AMIN domain-containing protein [bacterium]